MSLKSGDKYKLECGHDGKIIWISSDQRSIGVRGIRKSCNTCGKKSTGTWSPNVYIFTINDNEE